jgi:8-oxo-dGTP diphosphatase
MNIFQSMPIIEPDPSCLNAKDRKEYSNHPVLLVVSVALIDVDGRILLAQRPEGRQMSGLWEFPGGKIEEGETPEVALVRELKEELGIDITESCLAPFSFASHVYDNFHLLMPLYLCRLWKGTPSPKEQQKLKWVRLENFNDYPMPPADLPLVAMLKDFL